MMNAMIAFARIALAAALAAGSIAPADGPPKVVLIVTDDQGFGDLSCHGNPGLKTPNRTGVWHTRGAVRCYWRTNSPWAGSSPTPATPPECSASGTWATTTRSGPRTAASAR